jgi:hypothetical protein
VDFQLHLPKHRVDFELGRPRNIVTCAAPSDISPPLDNSPEYAVAAYPSPPIAYDFPFSAISPLSSFSPSLSPEVFDSPYITSNSASHN